LSLVPRKVKLIAAAKSMRRPIVGHIGRMMGGIPVERPQDLAVAGTGTLSSIDGNVVYGNGTLFLNECKPGC